MGRRRKSAEKASKPSEAEVKELNESREAAKQQTPGLGDQVSQLKERVDDHDKQLDNHSAKLGDLSALMKEVEEPVITEIKNDKKESPIVEIKTDDMVSMDNDKASENIEMSEQQEAIRTGVGELKQDMNEIKQAETAEDKMNKMNESSERNKNDIEGNFGEIIEVTVDEEGNAMSDIDKIKNEETGSTGIDALYEDVLDAESTDDPEEKAVKKEKAIKRIEEAVGDRAKAEQIYDKATEDENMLSYHNALFMEKMRLAYATGDPDLIKAIDDEIHSDKPTIAKLKNIDRILGEAAKEHKELARLHGLSKKIDKSLGVESVFDAYEEIEERGIESPEIEKAIVEMEAIVGDKFESEEQPIALEGIRIMANEESPVLASLLLSGEVEYIGSGKFKSELGDGRTMFVDINMDTKKINSAHFKHGEREIDIRKTHPNEAVGINEASGKLMAYQIGADSIAEDSDIMGDMMKDVDGKVIDGDAFKEKKEILGAILGCGKGDIKISSNEANARLIDLKIKGQGANKQIFNKLFEWCAGRDDVNSLRETLQPEDLTKLVSIWTKNDDGSLKAAPTFDTTIKLEKIRNA